MVGRREDGMGCDFRDWLTNREAPLPASPHLAVGRGERRLNLIIRRGFGGANLQRDSLCAANHDERRLDVDLVSGQELVQRVN